MFTRNFAVNAVIHVLLFVTVSVTVIVVLRIVEASGSIEFSVALIGILYFCVVIPLEKRLRLEIGNRDRLREKAAKQKLEYEETNSMLWHEIDALNTLIKGKTICYFPALPTWQSFSAKLGDSEISGISIACSWSAPVPGDLEVTVKTSSGRVFDTIADLRVNLGERVYIFVVRPGERAKLVSLPDGEGVVPTGFSSNGTLAYYIRKPELS